MVRLTYGVLSSKLSGSCDLEFLEDLEYALRIWCFMNVDRPLFFADLWT